jgi:glycosyltransferase involved in cell wall biosynthesis
MLETQLPFLKQKLTTVYNIVDLELFHPQPIEIITADNSKAIRVVVAARYEENKNMVGVARAMLRIKEYSLVPAIKIDWYGCESGDPAPYNRAARIIVENGLSNDIQLHPPTERIANEFASADAVGLFSFYEGLPNAVSEGMACGKPILLSNVCDAGNLVQDGKNGFLCEPNSPESIADSLMRFAAMNKQKQLQMGLESRRMAETLFAENVVIERYERILQAAASHQAVPSDCNWPMHVPESAIKMVESKTVHRTKINYSEESD